MVSVITADSVTDFFKSIIYIYIYARSHTHTHTQSSISVHICGLVVRVSGYISRGPGLDPALPNFLRSSGSGTGSTQPREYN
jgi:hypothetical protein